MSTKDLETTAHEWQRVEFPSRRGTRLVGCWHDGGGRRAVILCHGMESCKEGDKSIAMAHQLSALGCDVLRFDFSYVGESEGHFHDITVTGEVEDLAGAWSYAGSRIDGPIGIVGSSLGGTVALLFAAQAESVGSGGRDIAALATIAAVAVPGRRARALSHAERARWRSSGSYDLFGVTVGSAFLDDVEELDVPKAIPRIRCPLLITHGTDDEVVPTSDAETIANAATSPTEIRLYQGADHRFSEPRQRWDMLGDITTWMNRQLG